MLSIELPWPPSINHYWRHTRNGHYISTEGKAYRALVCYSAISYGYQNRFEPSDRLCVLIDAFPPDKRKRDLDNLFKVLLDSLQRAKVYEDDSQIDILSIRRKTLLSAKVHIAIEKIS